jgi:bifunctional DNA-binding transcriptional regulator/antitoxin component of YhaV-PrlF toxin-antitoxin module
MVTTTTVERGSIPIPEDIREQLGLEDGTVLIVESDERGLHFRPAFPDVEIYTPERIAEFLLNNAINLADYEDAVAEVRKLGIDPESVPHVRPTR